MKKIIYIAPSMSTFVDRDIRFLSSHFRVLVPEFNWLNKRALPVTLLRQKIYLLTHIWSAEAIIIMFGGYWSLLPVIFGRLTGKPVYIITGGTDCVSFPEFNYGSLRKPLMAAVIRFSYRYASRILPVSESLVSSEYTYDKVRYKNQGYLSFFPSVKTPYTVIHNGYDPEEYHPVIAEKNFSKFITVAFIPDRTRFILKGCDTIVSLSRQFPELTFIIAGVSQYMISQIESDIPKNLKLMPPVSGEEAKSLMAGAGFYLSLSLSEGFPNAVCEAMLMGCIPVGSDVGATGLIMGESGFLIKEKNDKLISDSILRASQLPADEKTRLSAAARDRIVSMFPLKERESALLSIVKSDMTG